MRLDHASEFGFERSLVQERLFGHAGHVLPDHDSHFVARVVVPIRLNLDVLTKHVTTVGFDGLEVKEEAVFGWIGVEAIGIKTLVKGAKHKGGHAVEHKPVDTICIFANRYFANAEIAFDFIKGLVAIRE